MLLISGVGTTFIYLLTWSIASDAIDHPALLYLAIFLLLHFVYPLGKDAVEAQQKEKEARLQKKVSS